MKQVAYFVLVAAVALAAPIPAAMAGPGEGEFLLEDDGYQPLLPDVGGAVTTMADIARAGPIQTRVRLKSASTTIRRHFIHPTQSAFRPTRIR